MTHASLTLRDPHSLRTAMHAAGLDGAILAEKAGVSRQFVSLLLSGQRRCRPEVATAIAQALRAPTGQYFVNPTVSEHSSTTSQENSMVSPALVENDDPYLYFAEVAVLVNLPVGTLRHLRLIGQGPKFFKVGQRLKIRKSAALAWMGEYEKANSE